MEVIRYETENPKDGLDALLLELASLPATYRAPFSKQA